MPKLRIDDDELPDDLDDVEYDSTRRDYEKYDGEQPPRDTFLLGYVKNVWWTETNGGDRMLKVLWIADGNKGAAKKYNGLDVWENLALTANAKFKWGPFFEYFGLSIKMLKSQSIIDEEEDNIGCQIKKIGRKFVPGEDCRVAIITSREKYNGNWQTHAAEWLDEDEEPEDEDELDDELEDEEEEDLEDEEDEEEAPPTPKRPTARKPAAASTTKTSARPKAAASPSAKSAPAKAAARPARPAAKPAAKASARPASTKRRSAAVDDDPPF